jgi:hypothetical protein
MSNPGYISLAPHFNSALRFQEVLSTLQRIVDKMGMNAMVLTIVLGCALFINGH